MTSGFVRKSSLIAALAFVACGKDSSGPVAVPTSVALAAGAAQTATVGTVVTPALTFSVKDQNGNSLAGVPVTITVTGGGTVSGAPTTTSGGETSIGTWTLGTLVGVNTLTIKAGSLAPTTFSITTIAGAPTQIIPVTGGGQNAFAGATLAPILVKVADKFGNGISGSLVTITVSSGGGAVLPATGTTDTGGLLGGITWTLGKSALPQTLSLVSGSVVGTIPALVSTSYGLEVRYFGGDPTPAVKAAFDNAAARIKGAIVGAVGPVVLTDLFIGDPAGHPNTDCGVTGVTLNETVPGIIIYAQIKPIDGVGKILGSAGPCIIRNTSQLTIIGVMNFDSDDLAKLLENNSLEPVILHEMSHVIGFGTLWTRPAILLLAGEGGPNPRFTGPKATAQCTLAGGTTLCTGGVAVENCTGIPNCGAGTQDSHWREGSGTTIPGFKTELMTGFISGATFNPYSNMTIQSFADMGYVVNGLAADPYTVPSPTLRALLQLDSPSMSVNLLESETIRHPQAMVSRSGVITRIERQ